MKNLACLLFAVCIALINALASFAVEALPSSNRSGGAFENLSPLAREIATLTGVAVELQKLQAAQSEQLNESSLQGEAKRQKLIYIRGKINSIVQAANLQINSTRGRVEASIAQADELRALITERRNRLTHRNSQINLLSGGVTKIAGYSIALAKLTDIPTNVLEVFDGTVQTSLTGLALRQEQQEAKLEHGMPAILESFLNEAAVGKHYPQSIWKYMNNVEPGKNKSRRQEVIDSWQRTGILAREKKVVGQSKTKRNITIELLDQRVAMLSDLKSLVTEMHNGLMELGDAIVSSYSEDPQW